MQCPDVLNSCVYITYSIFRDCVDRCTSLIGQLSATMQDISKLEEKVQTKLFMTRTLEEFVTAVAFGMNLN